MSTKVKSDQAFALLYEAIVPVAHRRLASDGRLAPFGAVLDTAGRVIRVLGADEAEIPRDQNVCSMVEHSILNLIRRGTVVALASVANVIADIGNGTLIGTVGVHLEHQSGNAEMRALPFTMKSSRKWLIAGRKTWKMQFETVQIKSAEIHIFPKVGSL